MTNKAVLLIVFNRIEESLSVIQKIKEANITSLYIASDGPREYVENEGEIVKEIRETLINFVDWNCEIKTLFHNKNLGCKNAVTMAIDWFFSNEEEGIIIEDDCVPNPDFFKYASCLLDKYRDNEKIWHIGGFNPIKKINNQETSYFFSNYPLVWGWATWRSRWKKYNKNIENFSYLDRSISKNLNFARRDVIYWEKIFKDVFSNKIDTWDYQWVYCVWIHSGLSIIPNKNLITNIGFNEKASHTKNPNSKLNKMQSNSFNFPITFNEEVIVNNFYDKKLKKLIFKNPNIFIKFIYSIYKIIKNDY